MCSTSSSECERGYNEREGYRNQGVFGNMHPPFYTPMGHPMIYYAQVKQPPVRQRSREHRQSNQNCFTKAFKWYTQDHIPYRNDTSNNTDMNGFAVWLDSKYDEFLRHSQLNSVHRLKMKQTSIIEAERITNKPCSEPPRSKRFRVKSPWRRKKITNSKEGGDGVQKSKKSLEVILQPKDLSRATSECCQKSYATITSMEIPVKCAMRSQSYTVVPHGQEHVCCDLKTNSPAPPATDKFSDNRTKTTLTRSVSCQCSAEKVVKINVQTQFVKAAESVTTCVNQITHRKISSQPYPCKISTITPKTVETNAPNTARCCSCSEELSVPVSVPSTECECPPTSATKQYSPSKSETCQCVTAMEEFNHVQNALAPPVTFLDDCIQTSDHSIRLEKDSGYGYPLFMKIVCADKLLSKQ